MNAPAMLSDESRELISLLAFIYLENNRPERATALLHALEAVKASDNRNRCALALAQLRSGKPSRAGHAGRAGHEGAPTAVFHLLRSDCLQALERHEEAMAAMRAFVALRQQAVPARRRIMHNLLNRGIAALTSRNDIILAVMIVAIIFMMILPLPTLAVDALIGVNMTISATLLMVAMYLPSPLAFSSFPSVLLVTTLFRLGISIATTRLILLQGDAGHIIETFGNFVVGGNLIVGLVVFLILTIVQFVVITKGAERVAEVAARFSLDAMPGKQMSIDADLRAGTIDMDQARQRRSVVEKESQLYGAMDGAMKFVKGDAIAGLIIVAVNLLGGILIGTLQRGMTAGNAVQVYSILTIGDGLIAQIPALFIAICAGIIVTRVQTGDGPSNVGRDIGSQVLAQPRALVIAAAIALGMGLIPGMPTLVFAILALAVGTVGLVLLRSTRKVVDEKTGVITEISSLAPDGQKPEKPKTDGSAEFAPSVPLMLDVAAGLQRSFNAETLNAELMKIRRALYFDLGVPFPASSCASTRPPRGRGRRAGCGTCAGADRCPTFPPCGSATPWRTHCGRRACRR